MIRRKMFFIPRKTHIDRLPSLDVFIEDLILENQKISSDIKYAVTKKSDMTVVDWDYSDSSMYEIVTHQLYLEGGFKNSFKKLMGHVKANEMAFVMPSINMNACLNFNPEKDAYQRWYSEKVPKGIKPFDATPGQKVAVRALCEYLKTPHILYSSTIFDHDHLVKHSYNVYLEKSDHLNGEIAKIHKQFGDHIYKKIPYDSENNIQYIESEHFFKKDQFRFHYFNEQSFIEGDLRNVKVEFF